MVVREDPVFVAVGHVLEIMAMGYARTTPSLAKVARLANHLP